MSKLTQQEVYTILYSPYTLFILGKHISTFQSIDKKEQNMETVNSFLYIQLRFPKDHFKYIVQLSQQGDIWKAFADPLISPLISSNTNMWTIAHVPLISNILCLLWKKAKV